MDPILGYSAFQLDDVRSRAATIVASMLSSRTADSGLKYFYGVDYRTLRWIYLLDPPKGLGGNL